MKDRIEPLKVEHLNVLGMNPFVRNDSSSRQYMFGGHISQAIVLNNGSEKRVQTGMEKEFGKYTFNIKFPCNAKILKVIERFPHVVGINAIRENPETLIFYEDLDNREISVMSVERYQSFHQHFGFPNVPNKDTFSKIKINSVVPKDTVLVDSPNIGTNGEYKYGVELEACMMTHPCVAEDAFAINRESLHKLNFKLYEKRSISFGKSTFPLNIYGDIDTYKIFPDIGEDIRPDGLLFASRSYDENFLATEMNKYSCMKLDPIFDKTTYSRAGKGRVVDIKIMHNNLEQITAPENMVTQLHKYVTAQRNFYIEILEFEKKLRLDSKRKNGKDILRISNELHRLVIEALIYLDGYYHYNNAVPKIELQRVYRRDPLDDFKIDVVIEYEITPTSGFKLTGSEGDKGVICTVLEPEQMPIDKNGHRADIIMDPGSTTNRTNLGRLYVQYLYSASRDIREEFLKVLNINPNKDLQILMLDISNKLNEYNICFSRLMKLYSIVSPKQFIFVSNLTPNEQLEHFASIIQDKIYLYFPPDNEVDVIEMVKEIESNFDLCYDTVQYVDLTGKSVVTKDKIRVGPMYFILLEKIADSWSAVSSARLQHFGILSNTVKTEKYSYPWRKSAVKTIGETEGRLYTAYCGPKAVAEMMDRNNNPITHKQIVKNILSSPVPTNIPKLIDRNIIPYGNTKPLQLMKHIYLCNGFKFTWTPEE